MKSVLTGRIGTRRAGMFSAGLGLGRFATFLAQVGSSAPGAAARKCRRTSSACTSMPPTLVLAAGRHPHTSGPSMPPTASSSRSTPQEVGACGGCCRPACLPACRPACLPDAYLLSCSFSCVFMLNSVVLMVLKLG
jgi:hypothetical protein